MKFFNNFITIRNYSFFKKSNIRKNNTLKIVLCGAAGKIGQPLSLLLKQSPYVEELALYDIKNTYGIGLELSHIDTKCQIKAYQGTEQLCEALNGAKIVAIVANTQDITKNLFEANANIISSLMFSVAECCPEALIGIATNPLNSIVPVAVNVMRTKIAQYDSKKIFGINSVDVVRANTLAANILGLHPERVTVPIIGGHSKNTIVPLFSQIGTDYNFELKDIEKLSKAVSDACESCQFIEENENTSLAPSFAIARFVSILAMAIKAKKSIIECAYVKCTEEELPNIKYCSTPLRINAWGIEENLGFPKMTEYENLLFKKSTYYLKKDIELGETYSIKEESAEVIKTHIS